ncbi:hypothetical protein BBJ28_00016108 [Nothophytophthora sp. Chile5]|nr:hypothetical protein BBJ28_00016108 [Nothophytophthora sp. Chile5]
MLAVPPSPWRPPNREQRQPTPAGRARLPVAAVLAGLAVSGRVVVAPLLLGLVFANTSYLTGAKMLIQASDSYFAFSQMDRVMIGGCTGCNLSCHRALMQFSAFEQDALMSKPAFQELLWATSAPESVLTNEALDLAESLETNAICFSGINEWASPHTSIAGEAQEIRHIISTLQLSVASQMVRELDQAIEIPNTCKTKWVLDSILRRYMFQATTNSLDYSSISAADFNVFPEYTECRPDIPIATLTGSQLALSTPGEDRLAVVPELIKLFPYGFTSSLAPLPREISTPATMYGARSVLQPLFRGYYGGCRVREVNTTGIFIEESCLVSKRWETYGLMLQSPDQLPVCSTDNVCIHNYYNSLWEWFTELDPDNEGRVKMLLNVFRNRYGDPAPLSILPGMVVVQMFMGILSLYQVMSHKRSVLLTQIWAYRCQNGRMQVLYFAQITYHLVSNSDIYYLGLATGTLTLESLGNLTFCFFAFSYSFVNLLKARSGEQRLARHFRLAWELIELFATTSVASGLYVLQRTSLSFIIDANGELLRKTSEGGAALCKLRDSCVVFTHNLALIATVASLVLGSIAAIISLLVRTRLRRARKHSNLEQMRPNWRSVVPIESLIHASSPLTKASSSRNSSSLGFRPRIQSEPIVSEHEAANVGPSVACIPRRKASRPPALTSFEKHCLGVPFARLFTDCNDIAYVTHNGRRYSAVDAVLLTGFLFYGEHVYQAQSVMLLLAARLMPRKLIRTFNVLFVRWRLDEETERVSEPLACSWYMASAENVHLSEARPIA